MYFKIKTKLSELTIEADQYRFSDGVAVFFTNHQLTDVLMDVQSIEPDCKFKLYDRVIRNGEKGVVTKIRNGDIYPVIVTFDGGNQASFCGDGRQYKNLDIVLSLVTPQWTGLELEYYNALIKAGASESAADYAVTRTLTSETGFLPQNFSASLGHAFIWKESPWGADYWWAVYAKIRETPTSRLSKLFSDKTPEIGDLVIAGDGVDDFYYVGVYIKNDGNSYPYLVEKVGNDCAEWFKNIKCLNL